MHKFKIALLATIASPAFATGTHPPVVETPAPVATPNTSTSSATGGSSQSSAGASSGSTSGSTAVSQSGADARNSGGNSATRVDASQHSKYRVTFLPPISPTMPSTVAIGNTIKETTACGPLQRIVRTPVNGEFRGIAHKSRVPQGWTDDLAPYLDTNGNVQRYSYEPLPDGSGSRMFGHQVIMFNTPVGVSGATNIAFGGFSGGNGGNAGGGSSSAQSRQTTTIQLRDCEIGVQKVQIVEVPAKRIRQ